MPSIQPGSGYVTLPACALDGAIDGRSASRRLSGSGRSFIYRLPGGLEIWRADDVVHTLLQLNDCAEGLTVMPSKEEAEKIMVLSWRECV